MIEHFCAVLASAVRSASNVVVNYGDEVTAIGWDCKAIWTDRVVDDKRYRTSVGRNTKLVRRIYPRWSQAVPIVGRNAR